MLKNYLYTDQMSPEDFGKLVASGLIMKKNPEKSGFPLRGKSVGLVFFNSSLRTRTSMAVAISSLGGHSVILDVSALSGGGTFFEPEKSNRSQRQEWLIATVKSGASIIVDKGAEKALRKGSSLLPSGVTGCRGIFKRGDSVAIKIGRKIIAYGIAEYNTKETNIIKGLSTLEVKRALTRSHSKVLVHRNNLTIVKS